MFDIRKAGVYIDMRLAIVYQVNSKLRVPHPFVTDKRMQRICASILNIFNMIEAVFKFYANLKIE